MNNQQATTSAFDINAEYVVSVLDNGVVVYVELDEVTLDLGL